jgi:hypothetical protein
VLLAEEQAESAGAVLAGAAVAVLRLGRRLHALQVE